MCKKGLMVSIALLLMLSFTGCQKENSLTEEAVQVSEAETSEEGKLPKANDTKLLEAPIMKEAPDEGDLLIDTTFYAKIPRNRYGGSADEGAYAPGKFLLWVMPIELKEDGSIVELSSVIVPYIVSDEGNDENLSMLSGGWDGENPYGDAILRLTTNDLGEIVDALFYHGEEDVAQAEQSPVQNNGGNFVKVEDFLYYISVPAYAYQEVVYSANYIDQVLGGSMCELMRYDTVNGGAPEVVAIVPCSTGLAYYEGCIYLGTKAEDGSDQIWEVDLATGDLEMLLAAKMVDIDEKTGRFVAIERKEDCQEIYVYEGRTMIEQVTERRIEEMEIRFACLEDDYLVYVEGSDAGLAEGAWGSMWVEDLNSDDCFWPGVIPVCYSGFLGCYQTIEQLVIEGEYLYFTICIYDGDVGVLQDWPIKLYSEVRADEGIRSISECDDTDGFLLESALPDLVLTDYQENEVLLDFFTGTIQWMKPNHKNVPQVVDVLTMEEFAYGSTASNTIEQLEYVDGKIYGVIYDTQQIQDESLEWWESTYQIEKVQYVTIDVESGELTVLEEINF